MLPEKWEGYRSARSLSILQKKKITPKNRLHDPYLLGTLISIAQENKARAAVRKELPEPRFLVSIKLRPSFYRQGHSPSLFSPNY